MKTINFFYKNITIVASVFCLNKNVFLDAAEPWQLGFQALAPLMEGIINFHNHIMFFRVGDTVLYYNKKYF